MTQLIVFRGLQGIGGGILTATVFTVISTLFAPAERARMQGLFSARLRLAEHRRAASRRLSDRHLSWRWVFYVNLPVGLIALAVLCSPSRHPRRTRASKRIDYLGAFTLMLALVPLLLALSWGGQTTLGLAAGHRTVRVRRGHAGVFLLGRARAAEPILPLALFKNRTVTISVIGLTIMGIAMFGTILFIPLFIQGVIGTTATQSGTALTPMMFAMIGSSVISGPDRGPHRPSTR